MNVGIIIFGIIVLIILVAWAVYNFYWLSQNQLYSVVKSTTVPFDKTMATAIENALGGKVATLDQLYNAMMAGSSNCVFSYAQCTGCSGISGIATLCNSGNCTGGYGAFNIRNIKGLTGPGVVAACGIDVNSNKTIGGNGASEAFGYWVFGSKPAGSTVTINNETWTVLPWVNNALIPQDPRSIFNRYEIFGIPKIL